jgi:hypothetical protein
MSNTDRSICPVDSFKQLETHVAADRISEIAPTDYHQNNASLVKLARLVKSYEHTIGRAAAPEELEFIFDRWSVVARRFWRPDLTRDDYYAEFLEIYSYVRIGLDENPIELAFSRAKAGPLPQVQGFTDERVRLLAAICREMDDITGGRPFFLPTRKLGEILSVHFSLIARWLRALDVLEIIHLAPGELRKCGGNRSPRYHYGKSVRETEALPITTPQTSSQPGLLTDGNHPNNVEDANHGDSDKVSLSSARVRSRLAIINNLTLSPNT